MKNLFYKEFRLCLSPVVYLFVCLFPLLILIPSYPIFVAFIYILSVYPFLFLGANKGQPTNDLFYSVLLPIRRKDIVIGRVLLLSTMQLVAFIIAGALSPLAAFLLPKEAVTPGLPQSAIVSVLAFAAVGFAIYDFIYVTFYYKKGKSILAPTLIGILSFTLFMAIFTLVLPLTIPGYLSFFNCNIGYQFLFLLAGLIIAVGIKVVGIKVASKGFEKADF